MRQRASDELTKHRRSAEERVRRVKRARAILSDHHGVWCAWCLQYIVPEHAFEFHHILGRKDEIREKFGFEPWVVPVHSPSNSCHRRGIQDYSDEAGRALLDAVAKSPNQSEEFEFLCKRAFYLGYFPASFLLRRVEFLNPNADPPVARRNLHIALIAASACSFGRPFVESLKNRPEFTALGLDRDAETRLYFASAYTNTEDFLIARSLLNELASKLPRVYPSSSPAYSKLLRQTAITSPTVKGASEAMAWAHDSSDRQYHLRTSRLALALAYENQRDYGSARAQADELGLDFELGDVSWWHYVGQAFLKARSAFLSEQPLYLTQEFRPALKALIRAQYAGAVFDFAGMPVPDFRMAGEPELVSMTPTEFVHWIGNRFKLSREAMTELRIEAIFDNRPNSCVATSPEGFQDKVLRTIRLRDS